ncbi:MAG: 1-acyl-sn-glycerol-3-phosphate acyltransferase [Bacilli bacterium]
MNLPNIKPRKEIFDKIKILEKEGRFNEHVDDIHLDNVYKVDSNYEYIKTHAKDKFIYWLKYNFVVKPFRSYHVHHTMHVKVNGRENLKGINNAIITSNHVFIYDCFANQYALRGHKTYITAAPFNSQKGSFGEYMRVGGMLPFSDDIGGMKNFIKTSSKLLKTNNYLLFYPEQSEWYCYEKPRPYLPGAFHFAVKFNVPIIPIFITFIHTGKKDKYGYEKLKFVVNIMKPIYKDPNKDDKENLEYLKDLNMKMCQDKYNEFYKK